MDEDKIIKVLGVIEIRTNDILQMQNIANNPRIIKDVLFKILFLIVWYSK